MDNRPAPTILSFNSTLVSNNRDDALREFIVAFFVEDSSFSVVEKVIPNSGFPGGKFLQRAKAKNPATDAPYDPDDITIGAEVTIGGWHFRLKSATEGTLKLMEAKSDMFSRSDLAAVIIPLISALKPRVEELRRVFQRQDTRKKGRVPFDDVGPILKGFHVGLGDQELTTLIRRFQFADSNMFEYEDFLRLVA